MLIPKEEYKHIFDQLIEMSEDGFIVVDTKGNVTDINESYCNFFGKKKEDVIGKTILNIIPNSKMIDIVQNHFREYGVIHTYVAGTSKERKIIVSRSYVEDEEGKVVAGVAQVKFRLQSLDVAKKLMAEYDQLEYYREEYKRIGRGRSSFDDIIGSSPSFLKNKVDGVKAANTSFSVLLTGETGTGKEVFANAIHNTSARSNKPMVSIDCASIPEELLESELFGYEEGAFTGAKKGGKKGKFLIANGGTIFLDEIGDMPLKMQAKLLRVLQERKIEPIGSLETIPIDVRIIAATRKDLQQMIRNGEFREDLFYRLNVINIEMVPLRERKDDILEIANYFLDELNREMRMAKLFSKEVLKIFKEYTWPGNIRELDNVIKSAYASSDDMYIGLVDLPSRMVTMSKPVLDERRSLHELLESYERDILEAALERNGWNCNDTAREMQIHRTVIYKKIKKYGLANKIRKYGFRTDPEEARIYGKASVI
ncbi:MAG: sigma 54-interacting transcriptional regulator [Fusobacteriaceae bacterium]|jgi:PAS domain S-box-containing protein|nr:sigma 54-interacting transcriptional regulator [Fusobacteriaceae bacterium]